MDPCLHFPGQSADPLCEKEGQRTMLVVDYQQLNEITIKDWMPLPLIGESLDQLFSTTIYTKLNIRDAYYNLQIAAEDE